MLTVEALAAAYGDSRILFGIDLAVAKGEVLALLGRNGMGKTTTVRSIFGLVRPLSGRIEFEGRDLTGKPPYVIAQAGLGLVPEGRQIFPTLSVEENLIATSAARFGPATLDAGAPSTTCSRGWPSAAAISARSSPAASSRCSPLAGR